MSYLKKIEYKMLPEKSFEVLHNCGGCGGKSNFVNTGRFRVNANGNRLDVWLIYRCEKCKHTLNIPIYERISPEKIPKEEYPLFLRNDEKLAKDYGRNFDFFKKNQLNVDTKNISYRLVSCEREEDFMDTMTEGTVVSIENPFRIHVRPEKLAAELWGISRTRIKKMIESGQLRVEEREKTIEISVLEV